MEIEELFYLQFTSTVNKIKYDGETIFNKTGGSSPKITYKEKNVETIKHVIKKNEGMVVEPQVTWSVWYQETFSNPYFAGPDTIETEILLYEGIGTAPTQWAGVPLDEDGKMLFYSGESGEPSVFFRVVVN